MKKKNFKLIAKNVISTEIESLRKLKSFINNSFEKAVETILNRRNGKIIISGIGKSGIIGKKISSVINSGALVSDQIVSDLIEKILADKKYKNRIIFDGYPRNLNQAKNLDILLKKYQQKIDIVLKLSVSLKTIKKRISERRTLEKRDDDSEEIAIKRYETYEKSTEPVIEYYKKLKLFTGGLLTSLYIKSLLWDFYFIVWVL